MSEQTGELPPSYNKGNDANWKEVPVGEGKEPLLELDYPASYPKWAEEERTIYRETNDGREPGDHKFLVRENNGKYEPALGSYGDKGDLVPVATTALTEAFPTKGQAQAAARLAFETFLRSKSKSDWNGRIYDMKVGKFVLPSDSNAKK